MFGFAVLAFSSLFAVIDPPGCIPFFSGLTARMEERARKRVLRKALLTAFLVLLVFTLAGQALLSVFGITLGAFRIAGGVIFFGIGLDMLQSRARRWRTGINAAASRDHIESGLLEEEDPSITPLAVPLIAGPGSITTVMVLCAEGDQTLLTKSIVIGATVLILLLTGGILIGADMVLRRVGHTGLKIVEKLMGLLLTVIAVQFILNGLRPYLESLLK